VAKDRLDLDQPITATIPELRINPGENKNLYLTPGNCSPTIRLCLLTFSTTTLEHHPRGHRRTVI